MGDLDPTAMTRFCLGWLPDGLVEYDGLDRTQAEAVGQDVLRRAEAFAALDEAAQYAVTAPFVEEVHDYEPHEATAFLKAAVTVVVRNSQLEEAHAHGPLEASGIRTITRNAAGPLTHLLLLRRREPELLTAQSPFADLSHDHPRVWAAMSALTTALREGGRVSYRSADGPMPTMPDADETVAAQPSSQHEHAVVESAIDPTFNQHLVDVIHQVVSDHIPFVVPTLSRISRNSDKQMRVVEILLTHEVPILTTNYLLRSGDVWVRRGALVTPTSHSSRPGLGDLRGLSGAHRKVVETVAEALPQ